jgi:hypothetical protein
VVSEHLENIRIASELLRLQCADLAHGVLAGDVDEAVAEAIDNLVDSQLRALELELSCLTETEHHKEDREVKHGKVEVQGQAD